MSFSFGLALSVLRFAAPNFPLVSVIFFLLQQGEFESRDVVVKLDIATGNQGPLLTNRC